MIRDQLMTSESKRTGRIVSKKFKQLKVDARGTVGGLFVM